PARDSRVVAALRGEVEQPARGAARPAPPAPSRHPVVSVLERLPASERRRLPSARPRFHPPMLATLTDARFSGDDWLFELKLDGERTEAVRDGDDLHLVSRNGKLLDGAYPDLVDALAAEELRRFVVD